MSPKSEHVARELLAIGFRAYHRGVLNGFIFACLTVALFSGHVPTALSAVWLAAFAVLAVARFALARAFLRADPPFAELDDWVRRAAWGFAATGLAWGVMGAAAIHYARAEPLYSLWVIFLIALFAVQHTQNTGAHPWVFRAFLLTAMVPIVFVTVFEDSPNYWVRLFAEAIFFGMALLAGRSGNQYVAESIAMRYENLELLEELRRQKEELDRANVAQTRFLAAASHDLRQPMQAIALLVDGMRERVRNPENQRIADSISTSVEAMSTLLNEILDISKLDAGVVKPRPSVFDAGALLERLRGAFAEPAARKGLRFRVRPCGAVLEADEVLLYRIVSNLVQNALRYTDSGGVLVGCRPRAGGIAIEVWDTGIGIPADQHEEIFREFHQLANPHRDRTLGFGLGLSIVRRSARVMGLPLALRSRVGRGSVFSIVVPRGDPAQVGANEPTAAPVAALDCSVLVVEDDREIGSALILLLESWGCRVVVARSGVEVDDALERLAGVPDAVVADYRLPGSETGLQVIERVRERHPAAAAIVMTGDVEQGTLRAAEAAGHPVLHKPLRPARLRSLLAAALRRRPMGMGTPA